MYTIPVKFKINDLNKDHIPYIISLLKKLEMLDKEGSKYLEGQYECIKWLDEMGVK